MMTKEQFQGEVNYRISMNIAARFLKKGLITEREYAKIDTIMLKKYEPILGSLR